jgi:hypothetical protein
MTTRRDFITLLGGGGGVADLGARQQAAKIPRVGTLSPASSEAAASF